MVYYIVHKIEKINDNIVETEIGFVHTQEDATLINSIHEKPFLDWFNENVEEICTVGGVCYFTENEPFYRCYEMVSTLGDRNITRIKNINTLEI